MWKDSHKSFIFHFRNVCDFFFNIPSYLSYILFQNTYYDMFTVLEFFVLAIVHVYCTSFIYCTCLLYFIYCTFLPMYLIFYFISRALTETMLEHFLRLLLWNPWHIPYTQPSSHMLFIFLFMNVFHECFIYIHECFGFFLTKVVQTSSPFSVLLPFLW